MMNKNINRIKLYIKKNEKADDISKIIKKELLNSGFKIVDNDYDLAISIGGDGTFLKMIHENNFNPEIYYVGVNAGSLGFLTTIDEVDLKIFIQSISKNKYYVKEANIIKSNVFTDTDNIELYSFNEIIIKKINQATFKTNLYIDNNILEHFVGDGLLISSSSGSTAHNLSFGGPIVDEDIKSLIITPIAPINNQLYHNILNSVVISNKHILSIIPNKKENICFLSDGKIVNINNVYKIENVLVNNNIKVLSLDKTNNIEKINKKII